MRKFALKAAAVVALSAVSAVASAGVGFSQNQTAFTFGTNYLGTFSYGGNTYGAGSTFNVNSLPSGFTTPATSLQVVDGALRTVSYRFYKQAFRR
ncbi:hypothetical protein [Thauera sp. Sel9]|uniref:hypothetical protein n=1 Tax=Thauera sp. Sel9 TaxID=2974299 RepID=UPI0021E11A9C|nr:hypothetical protein [Thauera sp. Sel9]MCV2217161.1 hypothetical protein [Thauera sp. Sel9]